MRILGIETSCDETAIAIIEGRQRKIRELKSLLSSQTKIHQKYGGIVPEVAARRHLEVIIPLLQKLLGKRVKNNIDVIAVTAGPGLMTSLSIGVETARTLAYAWEIPLIRVNHIEGHIYSALIGANDARLSFPALCLIVSGGHTELILMTGYGRYSLIGRTRDDAAGEAFDKIAKMLNLGFPGGPAISKLAKKGRPNIPLPRPMIESKDFDFSFAGLKTAVLYFLQDKPRYKKDPNLLINLCASVESAIVEVLVVKTIKAAKKFNARSIILGGGVAANTKLRNQLGLAILKELSETQYLPPELKYTTDNAAMIAVAGFFHAQEKNFISWQKLKANPNWELV